MAVAFKNPGDPLDAAEWNAIFSVADAALTSYFRGLSLAFLPSGALPFLNSSSLSPKKFFFFDPANLPANIHPLVTAGLIAGMTRADYLNQYNHAAVMGVFAALPVDNPVMLTAVQIASPGTGYFSGQQLAPAGGVGSSAITIDVVNGAGGIVTAHVSNPGNYTAAPGLTANAATGGTGNGATFNLTLSGVAPQSDDFQVIRLSYTATNPDTCLSVLTRPINGKPYAVTIAAQGGGGQDQFFLPPGDANGFPGRTEEVHVFEQVELFIVGNTTFDVSWNKYNMFRVHNFGNAAASVTFDNGAIVIPPGACRCVRRTGPGGTYTPGYNYTQKMLPGDPRFYAIGNFNWFSVLNWPTYLTNWDVLQPLGCLRLLCQQQGRNLDPGSFWDMSSLYSSLLAPPQMNSLIGDLLVTKGEFLAVRWGSSNGHQGGPLFSSTSSFITLLSLPSVPFPGFAGSGYLVGQIVSLSIDGGGTNQPHKIVDATARITSVDSNGAITGAVLVNGGTYLSQGVSGQISADVVNPSGGRTLWFPVPYGAAPGGTVEVGACVATPIQFTGFANIAAAFLQANPSFQGTNIPGVVWSFNTATGVLTLTANQFPPQTYWLLDFVDVGTNLITFLTGTARNSSLGTPPANLGGGALSVNFAGLKQTFTRARRTVASNVVTPYSYFSFTFDGTSYHLGSKQIVNVTNQATNADVADVVSADVTILDTAQKLANLVSSITNALTTIQDVQIVMSAFGPILFWDEAWPFAPGFNLALLNLNGTGQNNGALFISAKAIGGNLIVRRAFFIAVAFNNSFAPSIKTLNPQTNFVQWGWFLLNQQQTHFPRVNRKYAARQVNHIGSDEPWQNNNAAYQSVEPPRLRRYFETKPVSTESVFPGGKGGAGSTEMAPFARMGSLPMSGIGGAGDSTGILLAKWLESGATDFEKYLGAVGDGARGTATPTGAVLQLRNEVEHYNLLASELNGLPDNPKFVANVGLNWNGVAWSGFPAYGPARVPIPPQTPNSVYGNNFYPKDEYFGWTNDGGAQYAALEVYLIGLGFTIYTGAQLPDNYGAALPIFEYIMAPDGSISNNTISGYAQGFTPAFQAQVANYRWVKINDAQTACQGLGIPFVVNKIAIPIGWEVFNVQGVVANPNISTAPNSKVYPAQGVSPPLDPNVNGYGLGGVDGGVIPLANFLPGGPNYGQGPYDAVGTPIRTSPDPDNGGGLLGNVNQIAAGFYINRLGNWWCDYSGQNICALTSPAAPLFDFPVFNWVPASHSNQLANFNVALGAYVVVIPPVGGGDTVWGATETYTIGTAVYDMTYPLPAAIGTPLPSPQSPLDVTALVVTLHGSTKQAVVIIPKNYAYSSLAYDLAAVTALGTSVIPIIADNVPESNASASQVLGGDSGTTLITTNLNNAVVLVMGVDG